LSKYAYFNAGHFSQSQKQPLNNSRQFVANVI